MNPTHAERLLTKWTADHPSVRSYKSSSPIKTGVTEKVVAEWREVIIGIENVEVMIEEAALLKGTDSEIGVELAAKWFYTASIADNQVTCK